MFSARESDTIASNAELGQLIALTDELAALTRIGMPLELGLRDLGRDLPRRLARVIDQLRQRLEAGEDLAHVIATSPDVFPPAYQAVLLAGLRAGRLPSALQSVASSAGQLLEVRRTRWISMIYPVMLLIVGYVVLVFMLAEVHWPRDLIWFRESMRLPPLPGLAWLEMLGRSAYRWAHWPPGILLVLGLVVWVRHRKSWRFPGRRLRDAAAWATFSEVLAVLVEQHVPLDEAVPLAAGATDSEEVDRFARQWVARLRSGATAVVDGSPAAASGPVMQKGPPWLVWLISLAPERADLATSLRHAARYYRERLVAGAFWYARVLPVVVTLVIGVAMLAALTAIFWAPYYSTLYSQGWYGN